MLRLDEVSAILSANRHDIASFTPEFLASNELVPVNGICTSSVRSQGSVTITYEGVKWWLTEDNLWITEYPNLILGSDVQHAGLIVPGLASRYLESVPYSPVNRIWFHWVLTTIIPRRDEWMRKTFLPDGLPIGVELAPIETLIQFVSGNVEFRLTVRRNNDPNQQDGDSVQFTCFASSAYPHQNRAEIVSEANLLEVRTETLERVINHLLGETAE